MHRNCQHWCHNHPSLNASKWRFYCNERKKYALIAFQLDNGQTDFTRSLRLLRRTWTVTPFARNTTHLLFVPLFCLFGLRFWIFNAKCGQQISIICRQWEEYSYMSILFRSHALVLTTENKITIQKLWVFLFWQVTTLATPYEKSICIQAKSKYNFLCTFCRFHAGFWFLPQGVPGDLQVELCSWSSSFSLRIQVYSESLAFCYKSVTCSHKHSIELWQPWWTRVRDTKSTFKTQFTANAKLSSFKSEVSMCFLGRFSHKVEQTRRTLQVNWCLCLAKKVENLRQVLQAIFAAKPELSPNPAKRNKIHVTTIPRTEK